MRVFISVLAVICSFTQTYGGTLPPFLKPCSASDPKLNECMTRVVSAGGPKFTEGIPSFGISSLDPLQLGTIPVDNLALKLVFSDTVVSGLKRFKTNAFKLNPEKGTAFFDFVTNVTLKAHYLMDGRVLILPIRGDGEARIKITNLRVMIKYDYVTRDGHWEVPKFRHAYRMDRAQFKFTNLFGGKNKALADTTHRFSNENWSTIMQEIAPPAIDLIITRCVDEVKKFFKAVPAVELLTP